MAIIEIDTLTAFIIDFKPTEGRFNMFCKPDVYVYRHMTGGEMGISSRITMVILCMGKSRRRKQECEEHSCTKNDAYFYTVPGQGILHGTLSPADSRQVFLPLE
jgi:hypothetical protein